MEYTLTFEDRPEYLYANIRADITNARIAEAYMTEIHDECLKKGHTHALIHREVPVALHSFEYFSMAERSAPILQGIKAALLNPFRSIHADLEFFCLVANNRGAHYKLFQSFDEAESWLGIEPHSCRPLAQPRYFQPHLATV